MKPFLRIFLTFGVIFQAALTVRSQNPELESLLDAGIEGLLNAKIVSASKSEQRLADVAASVHVITAQEIKQRGYKSLEDVLSDLPGFQFRNIQGFNSYVFQRGIASQNNLILVMIDGVQVNELNSGGFYGGSQYLLENVEQVEIVHGPASALYGTNAISGVINLITKKAADHQGLDLTAGYGSFSTFAAAAGYGFFNPQKEFGLRVAGRYFTTGKAPLAGDENDYNWTDSIDNFENDVSIDISSRYRNFFFGMNLMNKQASRATVTRSTDSQFLDYGSLWNILFVNGYLSYHYERSDYTFNPRIYYRNSTVLNNTVASVTETSQIGYYRPGNLLGVDLFNQYQPVENLQLIGGIVLENEHVAENYSITYSGAPDVVPPAPPRPDMLEERLISLYLQGSYDFLKFFRGTVGFRYDNSSYYDEVVTPRLSLSFRKAKFSSSLLYNEAFRAPRPWDYTSGSGNPDLKPETIRSFEWNNSISLLNRLYLSATIYRNYLNNIIISQTYGSDWRRVNSGEISTDGIEITAKWRDQQLEGWTNYTYNFSTDEIGTSIPEIAKHSLNAGIQYDFNDWINAGLRASYLGERGNASMSLPESSTGMRFPEIDPALVINLSAGFTVASDFEVMIFANNLFDAKYYHTSNLTPDRYRQAGRNIYLQLHYTIQ